MLRQKLTVGSLLLLASSVLFESSAWAYCRTPSCGAACERDPVTYCPVGGALAYWSNECVSFSVQVDASRFVPYDQARDIVIKSFGAWQDADCGDGQRPSIRLEDVYGPAICHAHEYNIGAGNANVILFYDDESWPYGSEALGLTSVTFRSESGEIVDADMELNASILLSTSDEVPSGVYDLQSIVTHEAGHFLGLDHSFVPEATMISSYGPGASSLRTLEPDDMAAVCDAYPPGRAAEACNFKPQGGFSADCAMLPTHAQGCSFVRGGSSAAATYGSLVAGTAVLGFVLRRRRGRDRQNRKRNPAEPIRN